MADDRLNFDTAIDGSGFEDGISGLEGQAERGMRAVEESAGTHMQAFQTAISAGIGAATAMLTDFGNKAVDYVKGIVSAGDEYNKAMNQLSASTNATGTEMEKLEQISQGVYNNNFGDSFDDVSNAVALVQQQMGDLSANEMQSVTENAFAMRDVFGYDVSESVRSVNSLMNSFGITSEEAYNLMAQGAQNGLDFSDEMIDSINEYAPQFAKMGLGAEDMFSIFANGAENGAWNLDKIGDAVKENAIRVIDLSDSTNGAFESLGLDAEEMADKFSAGGETAQEAFNQVVAGLNAMSDPLEQNQVGTALFGTMWEDLGSQVVTNLSTVNDNIDMTKNTMDSINQVKYNDIGSAMEGLKRTFGSFTLGIKSDVSKGLAGAIGGFVNTINSADGDFSKVFDGLVEAGKGAVSAFAPLISNFKDKASSIMTAISDGIENNMPTIKDKAVEIIEKLASGFAESRQKLFEIAIPILTSIAEGVVSSGSQLVETAENIITGLCNSIMTVLPQILPIASELLNTIIMGIQTILPQLLPLAIQIIFALISGILTYLPTVVEVAVQIIMALITGIIQNVTLLLSAVITILTTLINLIAENLPLLIEFALSIVMALVNGILQNLAPLLECAITLVLEIVNALLQNLEPLLEVTIEVIMAIVQGITENLPLLIECTIKIINSIVQGIADNLPKILECAVSLIVQLVAGLVQAIPKIVAIMPQIADAIIDALMEVDWLQLGVDILKGLANGLIEGVSAIGGTIANVASDIVDGFKNFFGIHSPSRLFRDEIGQYIPQGIAVGVEAEVPKSFNDINGTLNTALKGIDINGIYLQFTGVANSQGSVPAYSSVYASAHNSNRQAEQNTVPSQQSSSNNGDLIMPISLFPNSQIFDTIVISAADRANAMSGGRSI